MPNNFVFRNNILYKDREYFFSFSSNIDKILSLENSVVVLLVYSAAVGNQNIFCFDCQKNQIWQILKPTELHSDNYFSAVYLRGNELYAYNINGTEYHLDKETGDILDTEMIK